MQKVKVRVRFNASKERFEKFAEGMYLIYLPFPEDDDSVEIVKSILSKKMGIPSEQIEYMGLDNFKDLLFVVG